MIGRTNVAVPGGASSNASVAISGTIGRTNSLTGGKGPPVFTYTGAYTLIDDGDDHWRIKFTTSGTLNISKLNGARKIDAFLVGGGGSGRRSANKVTAGGGGGGGGYYTLASAVKLSKNTNYEIVIGDGGANTMAVGTNGYTGEDTTAFGYTAAGGEGGATRAGGAGGATGGNGGYGTTTSTLKGLPGEDGSYEFNDTTSTSRYNGGGGGGAGYYYTYNGTSSTVLVGAYGAGGEGGGGRGGKRGTSASSTGPGTSGTANTGGGGGGTGGPSALYNMNYKPGAGGSGICIVRDAQ